MASQTVTNQGKTGVRVDSLANRDHTKEEAVFPRGRDADEKAARAGEFSRTPGSALRENACFFVEDPAPSCRHLWKLLFELREDGFVCAAPPKGGMKNRVRIDLGARSYRYCEDSLPQDRSFSAHVLTTEEFSDLYGLFRKPCSAKSPKPGNGH